MVIKIKNKKVISLLISDRTVEIVQDSREALIQ